MFRPGKSNSSLQEPLEVIGASLAPVLIHAVFLRNEAFSAALLIIYLSAILAGAAIGGFRSAGIAFLVSFLSACCAILLFPAAWPPELDAEEAAAIGFIMVGAALSAAFVRNRVRDFRLRMLDRLRKAIRKAVVLERQNSAFERVIRALESRVSSQKDTITFLHDQVKKLASLSMDKALATILETIAVFTEMEAGAIWVPSPDGERLIPAAVWGWPAGSRRETSLDLNGSIEGYVYRNHRVYSIRMRLHDSEFDRFEASGHVITMPIMIGGRSWGVLNVEALPFERYSQYTETILAILLSLSEPYLRQIREYEALNAQREVDPSTGFPLFSILYRSLERSLERLHYDSGNISLVILELVDMGESGAPMDRERVKKTFRNFKTEIDRRFSTRHMAFHYKEDSQLALLLFDLDQDGTSFFCLDLLSFAAEERESLGLAELGLDVVLGYSVSMANGESTAEAMIEAAEHLLAVQKV